MMSWSFTVPTPPRSKNRTPRVIRGGKVVGIPDKKTRQFEATVALFASRALPSGRIDGALRLEMLAVLERPQRLMRATDDAGLIPAPTNRRLDIENIVKGVNDGLARWFDDGQVTDLIASKRYAEKTGAPRVEVTITQLGGA